MQEKTFKGIPVNYIVVIVNKSEGKISLNSLVINITYTPGRLK